MKEYKLCYIENNFAYFTDDMDKQWGDDWDDAPYEHNAGFPYNHETELIKVAYEADLETPDFMVINSDFSVAQINSKMIPWLRSAWTDDKVEIWAGTTLEEFEKSIKDSGGKIYKEC